jgi:hypothetical protein
MHGDVRLAGSAFSGLSTQSFGGPRSADIFCRTCLTGAADFSTLPRVEGFAMKRTTKYLKRAAADLRSKRVLAGDREDTSGSC